MKVKTDHVENMCLENTTYYSDPEKWLPTQQRFQLKESPKIRPCLQNTRKAWQKCSHLYKPRFSTTLCNSKKYNKLHLIQYLWSLSKHTNGSVDQSGLPTPLFLPNHGWLSWTSNRGKCRDSVGAEAEERLPQALVSGPNFLLSRPRTVCEMIQRVIQGNWADARHKVTLAFPLKSKYRHLDFPEVPNVVSSPSPADSFIIPSQTDHFLKPLCLSLTSFMLLVHSQGLRPRQTTHQPVDDLGTRGRGQLWESLGLC